MTPRQHARLARATATLALLIAPRLASATPSKDQCVDADTQAQSLRRSGKLLGAREALRVCVDQGCPKLVSEDCTKRLDDLESAIPSITFAAKDVGGRDLSAVTVTIDQKPFADHLDGTAIDLDPGQHTFFFKAADLPATTITLLIQSGDRGRRETITLGSPPPSSAGAPPAQGQTAAVSGAASAAQPAQPAAAESHASPAGAAAEAPAGQSSTRKTLAWVGIGVGAVGIAVGGITAGLASGKKSSIDGDPNCQNNHCAPSESGLVNSYDQLRTVSSVGFIAGGLLAATGVTLLLTAPRPSQVGAGLWFGVGSVGVAGRFQ
jgi:hypothetical protein